MAYTIKDSQQTTIHAVGLDAQGVEVSDAVFSWASSDTSLLVVTPSEDGKSATAVTTGKIGDVTITVTSGSASATFEIHISTGEVVTITLTADAPSDRNDGSSAGATTFQPSVDSVSTVDPTPTAPVLFPSSPDA